MGLLSFLLMKVSFKWLNTKFLLLFYIINVTGKVALALSLVVLLCTSIIGWNSCYLVSNSSLLHKSCSYFIFSERKSETWKAEINDHHQHTPCLLSTMHCCISSQEVLRSWGKFCSGDIYTISSCSAHSHI